MRSPYNSFAHVVTSNASTAAAAPVMWRWPLCVALFACLACCQRQLLDELCAAMPVNSTHTDLDSVLTVQDMQRVDAQLRATSHFLKGVREWEEQGYSRLPSFPFISGDGFRAVCDFVCEQTPVLTCSIDTAVVGDGAMIFVQTTMLPHFVENIHPAIKAKYLIVSHNSEMTPWSQNVDLLSFLDSSNVVAWFAQNLDFEHAKVHPIPTGLPNRYVGGFDMHLFSTYRQQASALWPSSLLFANREVQTYEQQQCLTAFANRPWVTTQSSGDVLARVCEHMFIATPSVVGDSKLLWEALYLGRIPVRLSSPLDVLMDVLPTFTVGDWSEVDRDILTESYETLRVSPFDVSKLFMGYWLNELRHASNSAVSMPPLEFPSLPPDVAPLVLVSLGELHFQPYLWDCVQQARLWNPTVPLVLVADRAEISRFPHASNVQRYNVTVVPFEALADHPVMLQFATSQFVDDMWGTMVAKYAGMVNLHFQRRSMQRIWVLRALMHRYGLADLVHIENDVMLYSDVQVVAKAARHCGAELMLNALGSESVIAALVYCRLPGIVKYTDYMISVMKMGPESVREYLRGANFNEALMAARLYYNTTHDPTLQLSPGRPYSPGESCIFDHMGAVIIDTAEVGHFIGGSQTHPRPPHEPYVNPLCGLVVEPEQLEWRLDDSDRLFPLYDGLPLANVHAHCKLLSRFLSNTPPADFILDPGDYMLARSWPHLLVRYARFHSNPSFGARYLVFGPGNGPFEQELAAMASVFLLALLSQVTCCAMITRALLGGWALVKEIFLSQCAHFVRCLVPESCLFTWL